MINPEIPEWKRIHDEATIIDVHAHPSLATSLFNRMLTGRFGVSRSFDPFSVRTDFNRLRDGSVDVLLSTIYAPERGIIEDCKILKLLRFIMPFKWKKVFGKSYFEVTNQLIDEMEEQVENSKDRETGKIMAKMAYSVAELDAILRQTNDRPIAIIHNIEGAHSLDGKLENLQHFFDRGVAYLTLAHFYKNEVVHPIFPFPEYIQKCGCFLSDRDLTQGLTKFGEQVVEKMVELGMIIDIAHCTPPARKRIYDIVNNRIPIIASHVGAYEINPSPYNLKDWEIKKIADSGGVACVIFMNYWLMPHETKRGLNFITRTLDYFMKVGGADHAGIGTDFDGFTDPPDDLKHSGELHKLTQRLIAEEYPEDVIKKIWGGNVLRVLRQGWGKR
jgi:microsomal dipeptidase-like Zn-dependent dipeptidase